MKVQEVQKTSIRQVLWVGAKLLIDSPQLAATLEHYGYFTVVDFKQLSSGSWQSRFRDLLQSGEGFQLLVNLVDGFVAEAVFQVLSLFPNQPILLFLGEHQLSLLREIINRYPQAHVLLWPRERELLEQTLKSMASAQESWVRQQLLKQQSYDHHRRLEALTQSLEKIVQERTFFLSESTRQEQDKLSKQRQIVKFIKDLSLSRSEEELLAVLRRELKKFSRVGEPLLWVSHSNGKCELITFVAGQYRRSIIELHEDILGREHVVSSRGAELLANHFQRPFMRTHQVLFSKGIVPLRICIEADLYHGDLQSLVDFLDERIQYLSVAYDRIFFENELANFSYRWENTFDSISDPIAIVDSNFKIVRANKAFLKGQLPTKCFQILTGSDSPCENCPLLGPYDENREKSSVQIVVHGRIYQIFSYPVFDLRSTDGGTRSEQGKGNLTVNHYVDITDSRSLYLRVLQNEKMSAIGLLAGNIAHELNNPLTGIKSMAQVLKREIEFQSSGVEKQDVEAENLQLLRDLTEIENSASRCQKIIHNLLDFSNSNEALVQRVLFDDVVEKTLPMLKSVTRYFETRISLNAKNSLVEIEPHLIQQVIFNIVNNACQAMGNRGRISISSFRDSQNRVVLEIGDTGPGIPKEIQAKIFEPFFTTKKEGFGTGLGLSMSKQVLDRFRGTVKFRTEAGKGTTFAIYLPTIMAD